MAVTLKLEEMQEVQLRGQSVDAGELTRLAGQLHRVLAKLKQKAAATITPPYPSSITSQRATRRMTRRTRRPTTDAARGSRWNTLFYRRSGEARHADVFRKRCTGTRWIAR